MAPALVVIQSRLSSSRLPAKALMTVGGMPMVVLAAARAGNQGHHVFVATSDQPDDDLIADVLARAGVAVVRGDLDDTLSRFVLATEGLPPETVVVRMTADNVVPDGTLVEALVTAVSAGDHGYARIGGPDADVPYGLAGEATTVEWIRRADAETQDAGDREHVTPWIRRRAGDHVAAVPDVEPGWARLRCTVDTYDDLVRCVRLFSDADDPVGIPWRDLCARLAEQVGPLPPAPPVRARDGQPRQTTLVLGTVQLGVPYGATNLDGLPTEATAGAVLDECLRQGVSHLDTARAYGESEARIGAWAGRGGAELVGTVTKIRPLDDVPPTADPAWGAAAVRASALESRRALRTAPIDALLVHRAADWWRAGGGVRAELEALRASGACRAVGASLSTPEELVRLVDDPLCTYVQLPFNPLDHRWTTSGLAEALASRPDLAVTCRSVYLQGLLLAPDDSSWPAQHRGLAGAVHAALDGLVAELGRESRADLCIAYVLGHPWVTSVVIGAEHPAHVREAAQHVRREPLDADQVRHVRASLPVVPEPLLDPSTWST